MRKFLAGKMCFLQNQTGIGRIGGQLFCIMEHRNADT